MSKCITTIRGETNKDIEEIAELTISAFKALEVSQHTVKKGVRSQHMTFNSDDKNLKSLETIKSSSQEPEFRSQNKKSLTAENTEEHREKQGEITSSLCSS
ncbi:MAG: hypothetical protein ACYSTS_18410 [Planctomycetota bacterium]|jgi:hypothetical protein